MTNEHGEILSLPQTDQTSDKEENSPQSVEISAAKGDMEKVTKPVQSSVPQASKPTGPVGNGPAVAPAKPAGLASQVNARLASVSPIPKGLTGIDTSKPDPDRAEFWHGMIYAETSARKTTVAAQMFGPENTLIVLCRQPEQVRPLKGLGYKVLHCENDDALVYALQFPEQAAAKLLDFPAWANLPDRHIVFDDVTEGINLLLDRNSMRTDSRGNEVERKDPRAIYREAGKELKGLLNPLKRRKLHLTLIALARIDTNEFTNEETIRPDLPPSMANFVSTDLEFVFYIDKSKWRFVTDSVYRSYESVDEKGHKRMFRREVFAKNKLPLSYMDRRVFPATNEVRMDLAKVWASVKSGTPIEQAEPKK